MFPSPLIVVAFVKVDLDRGFFVLMNRRELSGKMNLLRNTLFLLVIICTHRCLLQENVFRDIIVALFMIC